MKKLMYLLMGSIYLLLGACSYQFDKQSAPDDLIPKDTFTLLLHEVMIVESYFKHQQSNVKAYSESLPEAILPIFEKYNVDSSRYASSMNYYSSRQEELIEIYSQIQDSLTLNTVEFE
ncbi:DUF4296 domain-containing protein [Brumimicrobium oceani]|uniref:DUF4296 domain-containing protein n=1 Tax=Brumimicrobium oceani TaxID=2100725 RepID=A0A2U2XD82_9FLAO|nr:DUF4296 domain-containing protein [Brumimicrobium oceani]PWH85756.1 hypothetical protein DIT68_06590 [Brumimicrobium oceani]